MSYGEKVEYEEIYLESYELESYIQPDTLWTEEIIIIPDSNVIGGQDTIIITVLDTILFNTYYDTTFTSEALGVSEENGKTRISYWEIPLYLSYSFEINDFFIEPGFGVHLGFLKVQKGSYLAKDGISLLPIGEDYYELKKTLVNATIMANFGYRLNEKWAFEISPNYRFNLNSVFFKDDFIQSYSSFALRFRLRYYF